MDDLPEPQLSLPESGSGISTATISRKLPLAAKLHADPDDDLKPARGLVRAVLFGLPAWGAIGLLIWFLLAQ
jgi:hypothetical protein